MLLADLPVDELDVCAVAVEVVVEEEDEEEAIAGEREVRGVRW